MMNTKPLTVAKLTLTAATVAATAVIAQPQTASAASIRVNYQGTDYDVSTITGTFVDLESTLMNQPWWGNGGFAHTLSYQVGAQLGTPNPIPRGRGLGGPLFAFSWPVNSPSFNAAGAFSATSTFTRISFSTTNQYTFATAQVVQPPATAIPTPALLPGLVGMGIAAYRKRKSAASAEA